MPMQHRSLIALAALVVLTASEARAASGSAAAHKQFSDLVARRAATVQPKSASQLPPAFVRAFDTRLTRWIQRHGSHLPPATDFLPFRNIVARQNFIEIRFTPGARVAGVFFTTSATPSVPGPVVNVFHYFPVFTTGA